MVIESRLCRLGLWLFVAGLVIGFFVQGFTNPRMGLSAHLAAVQIGTALMVLGVLWPRFALSERASARLGSTLGWSLYAVVAGLVLAAAFGAGIGAPIAAKGVRAARWQELTVAVLTLGGSLGVLVVGVRLSFARLGDGRSR